MVQESIPSPSPPSAVAISAVPTPSGNPLLFSVGSEQARYVAMVVAFLDAFNGGDVDRAVAFFAPDGRVSDCDHAAVRLIVANGLTDIRAWLQARAADHDRIEISRIFNANPDPAGGSFVVGVEFATRRSDSLAAAGFPNGIRPGITAKVVFAPAGDRIRAWAAGPFGGPIEVCRPH